MEGVTADQLTLAKVDPTELDYWTLRERTRELEAGGSPSTKRGRASRTKSRARSRPC